MTYLLHWFVNNSFLVNFVVLVDHTSSLASHHELANRAKCLLGFQYLFPSRSAQLDIFTAWTNLKLLKASEVQPSIWPRYWFETFEVLLKTCERCKITTVKPPRTIFHNNCRFIGRSRTGPTDYKSVYT